MRRLVNLWPPLLEFMVESSSLVRFTVSIHPRGGKYLIRRKQYKKEPLVL
jgi:hypothetical protein